MVGFMSRMTVISEWFICLPTFLSTIWKQVSREQPKVVEGGGGRTRGGGWFLIILLSSPSPYVLDNRWNQFSLESRDIIIGATSSWRWGTWVVLSTLIFKPLRKWWIHLLLFYLYVWVNEAIHEELQNSNVISFLLKEGKSAFDLRSNYKISLDFIRTSSVCTTKIASICIMTLKDLNPMSNWIISVRGQPAWSNAKLKP